MPIKLFETDPRIFIRDRQAPVACRFFDATAKLDQVPAVGSTGQRLISRVARQLDDLRAGYRFTEEHRRRFRQLMGFVENNRIAGRQQFAHAFVAQHDIREE